MQWRPPSPPASPITFRYAAAARSKLPSLSRTLAAESAVEIFGCSAYASSISSTKAAGGSNPRTTRTSCFYDFGRGTVGGQKGAPLWMEARGKWMNVNQGHARVPSFKGFGNTAVVPRVPFRKNGGGFALSSSLRRRSWRRCRRVSSS